MAKCGPQKMTQFCAVHKRCPHKIVKNLFPSPLSVRTHHKFQKTRSFLLQKVRKSASEELSPSLFALDKLSLLLAADVFY